MALQKNGSALGMKYIKTKSESLSRFVSGRLLRLNNICGLIGVLKSECVDACAWLVCSGRVGTGTRRIILPCCHPAGGSLQLTHNLEAI